MIIGYRRWRVATHRVKYVEGTQDAANERIDGPLPLSPLVYPPHDAWSPGKLPATSHEAPYICREVGWNRDGTRYARPKNTGPGLYAYSSPMLPCVCACPDDPSHGAVGVVAMWGRMVEHGSGYRSEFAEPVAVVDFTGRLDPAYNVQRYPDIESMNRVWSNGNPPSDHGERMWCYRCWLFTPIPRQYNNGWKP